MSTAYGWTGKLLWIDLTTRKISGVPTSDFKPEEFIGGVGLNTKIFWELGSPKVAAFHPDNPILISIGPLTGASGPFSRAEVCGIAPQTYPDELFAYSGFGGKFPSELKYAGFDHIVVTGRAERPVFIDIVDGDVSIVDAGDLWGETTWETEKRLRAKIDRPTLELLSIGPAGENLSLLAAIMNDKGRAAGRSGVGAVMGSKKLKAIVVSGSAEVPLADPEKTQAVRKEYIKKNGGFHDILAQYGTVGITGDSAMSGDSPVKNWGGVGPVDFPTGAENFKDETVIAYQDKKYGCWRCTMACGGHMSVKEEGPYKGVAHHKVEYETAAAWGTMTLMDKFPPLIKLNELCNKFGFDTIGTGCTAAFAVECYENGILTKEDTDGLELTWDNDEALVALLEKMGKREGIGALLADGSRKAAAAIGKGAEQYAMHVQGSEVPMHDPKFQPGLATSYKMDATPARHTQGQEDMPPMLDDWPEHDKYVYTGKGELHKKCSGMIHVVNAAGVCMFAYLSYDWNFVPSFLSAVTGWDIDTDECYKIGERIANIRHAFNLREGLNPIEFKVPSRLIGDPPQTEGNVRDITVDIDTQVRDYCAAMDWDPETAVPSKERLLSLGLEEVAKDLHP